MLSKRYPGVPLASKESTDKSRIGILYEDLLTYFYQQETLSHVASSYWMWQGLYGTLVDIAR